MICLNEPQESVEITEVLIWKLQAANPEIVWLLVGKAMIIHVGGGIQQNRHLRVLELVRNGGKHWIENFFGKIVGIQHEYLDTIGDIGKI